MTKKLQNKYANFTRAVKRLREAVTLYSSDEDNGIVRDGLIQRFEFTFELAWKTTAEVLREEGILLDFLSPKTVLRSAYEAGLIDDEAVWLEILRDRNLTSHLYDEEAAKEIATSICNRYRHAFANLLEKLPTK